MRTVFTNSMLAHVYAQQTQEHGRSNSMHFNGDTLYSYQTPVARIVKSPRRGKVLLLSRHTYSPTTSQHISAVRCAFAGLSLRVQSLGVSGGRHSERNPLNNKPDHQRNRAEMLKEYQRTCDNLRRRRSLYESVRESLEYATRNIREYCAAFNLKCPVDYIADAQVIEEYRTAREARLNTPANQAKRERARIAREARNARIEEEKRETLRVQSMQYESNRQEWIAGTRATLHYWQEQCTPDGSALLRIRRGCDLVETSQGAEVPIAHARLLFAHIKQVRASGNAWLPLPDMTFNVGHFTLSHVAANGDVRIGCHVIHWTEIERFTTQEGW